MPHAQRFPATVLMQVRWKCRPKCRCSHNPAPVRCAGCRRPRPPTPRPPCINKPRRNLGGCAPDTFRRFPGARGRQRRRESNLAVPPEWRSCGPGGRPTARKQSGSPAPRTRKCRRRSRRSDRSRRGRDGRADRLPAAQYRFQEIQGKLPRSVPRSQHPGEGAKPSLFIVLGFPAQNRNRSITCTDRAPPFWKIGVNPLPGLPVPSIMLSIEGDWPKSGLERNGTGSA